MPKKSTGKQKIEKPKSDRKIPPWGRKERHITKSVAADLAPPEHEWGPTSVGIPQTFAPSAPIGTNQPTMVQGTMVGGMPNWPRMARGRLETQRGKYRNSNMVY